MIVKVLQREGWSFPGDGKEFRKTESFRIDDTENRDQVRAGWRLQTAMSYKRPSKVVIEILPPQNYSSIKMTRRERLSISFSGRLLSNEKDGRMESVVV